MNPNDQPSPASRSAASADDAATRDAAHRRQTALFRMALALSRTTALVWHVAEDRLEWADDPAPLLGPRPGSGKYPTIREMIHPDDRQEWLQQRAQMLASKEGRQRSFRIIRTDGSIRWFDNAERVFHDAAGNVTEVLVVNQDITERKQADERLRRSEARFRSLTGLSSDWYWEQDSAFRFVEMSGDVGNATGLTTDEHIGKTRWELPSMEVSAAQWAEHKATLERHEPFRDFVMRRPDVAGRPVYVSISGEPIFDESGRFAGYRGVGSNVTQKVLAERELREAKLAAENANRIKSQFLANMSHEIRTPMNGVVGMTDLLLGTQLTPEQRRFAETLQASGRALLRIVDGILDFSKIEEGKLELDRAPFSPRGVIEDVVSLLANNAHAKRVALVADIDPTLPETIIGDEGRMRQVLTNLVGNAIKFTEKGSVVVSADVTRSADALTLHFAVTDTGIGIPDAARARLFEPFMQGDISTTRRFGGTGLGLAISRRLVNMMGGELDVQTAPGRGSRFAFTLALAPGDSEPASGIDPASMVRRAHVVIASADVALQRALQRQLQSWHVTTTGVMEPEAALQQLDPRVHDAAAPAVDAVLVDATLLRSHDAVRAFARRVRHTLEACPIVVLLPKGHPDCGDLNEQDHSLEAGATDPGFTALLLPVRQADLLEVMRLGVMRLEVPGLEGLQPAEPGEVNERTTRMPAPGLTATESRKLDAKVLLVEDNPVNQLVGKALLGAFGAQVVVAEDGLQALEALAHATFDVVLMDCQMPNMDGFEALSIIRAREQHLPPGARHKIVALTANAIVGERERCLALGFDDYLSKPYTREQLLAVLEKLCAAIRA